MAARRLLTAALASALSLTLVSCGDSDGGDSGGGDAGSVVYASYGGTLQDAEEKAMLDPFADDTGIKVTSTGPADNAKIKAQVESGDVQWDVVNVDPSFAAKHCGTLFEELDPDVVTNLSAYSAEELGSTCTMPFYKYGWILYYSVDKYGDNPPTTWADFYDPEGFPGKRGVWSYDSTGILYTASLANGVPADEVYPIDIDSALKTADAIKSDIVYADSPGGVTEQIVSGEIDMALMYNGRAFDAAEQDVNWKVAWTATPQTAVQGVSVLKGTKHKDAAFELANYFGSIEAQESFSQQIAYAPARTDADPQGLTDAKREFLMLDLPISDTTAYDVQWWTDNGDEADARWTDWQAG